MVFLRAKVFAAGGASHVPSVAAPRAKMAAMAENFILFDGVEICGFESFWYYLFALGRCIVSKRRFARKKLEV